MSDYTPTTEEVKNFYSERMSVSGYFEWSPSANAEFDDWLAQNNAEVAKATEQRIIKLLEGLDPFGSIDTAFVPELIALINGENEINNKIILTPEEFYGLEKSLTEPAKPNENLNKLLKGNK